MADWLVSKVLDTLASTADQQFKQVVGVGNEIESISSTFEAVRAVLNDAEKKQVKHESLNLWLERLKYVAYDMEDVLDEWSTELLRSQIEGVDNDRKGKRMKVCSNLFNQVTQLSLRHDIGHRIKEIKERLDAIVNEKGKFQLIESGNEFVEPQREMTSSVINVSEVCGRNLDKHIIVSKLLSESSQQEMGIPVISIVGMGGLGKTTLAQLAFDDENVKNHFGKTMWVCVSEPFDKKRVAKAIITEAVGDEKVPDDMEWNALHHRLCNSIKGKLFLLVLDDVWTEDYKDWEPLEVALKGGAQGSRIIVTTRNERVAMMIGSTYTHDLGILSDEECWLLFSRITFFRRGEEDRKKLEEIGKKITEKCKGVPLFVKTLASLMRFKRSKQDWQDVLVNDMWELPEVVEDISPALFLSYYDLPSHLKRCFTYCAVFPKDSYIKKDVLVTLWMAQGFLSSTRRIDLENVGGEYFDNLVMRSFFQNLEKDDDDNIIGCKMHDLVHDFAQYLTKNECSIIDELNKIAVFNSDSSKVVHLTVTPRVDINFILPSMCKAKKLRSLQLRSSSSIATGALPDLLNQLTCLRTLDLTHTRFARLPSEVEKLVHLRYLDLSYTPLKELPETVSNLYNLQTLKLYYCSQIQKLPEGMEKLIHLRYLDLSFTSLKELPETVSNCYNLQTLKLFSCLNILKLPEGMGKMVNLRHLVIERTDELRSIPQGIGGLSSLRTLSKFIVSERCKIGELKDLNLLQGKLEISGLGRVRNVKEAGVAELKKKEYLRDLSLKFYAGWENVNVERMEGVLESLQPHPNLKKLDISSYHGFKLPSWMMRNSLLPNLHSLSLVSWSNCNQLPALSSLAELNIYKMDKVKHIGHEFLGISDDDGTKRDSGESSLVVFPKLKKLKFWLMKEWEEWEIMRRREDDEEHAGAEGEGEGGEDIIRILPCLQELSLRDCPKLKALPDHIFFLDTLRKLEIGYCPELSWTASCFPPLLEELILERDAGDLSRSLPITNNNIKSFTIKYSPLSSLPKGLEHLKALQTLQITYCKSVEFMPEGLQHLTMLQKLYIYNCPKLKSRCEKEVGEDWNIISHIPKIHML